MKKLKLLTPILGVTALASTAAPIATLSSCGKTEATIAIGTSALALQPGETAELKATVTGSSKDVTWSTSDSSVAAVANGKVTAIKDGNAVITAEANGQKATCNVVVSTDIQIKLNHTEFTIRPDEQVQLEAKVTPAEKTVTWDSSDKSIATVDEDGLVTGVADGEVEIKAMVEDLAVVCKITVSSIAPTETDKAYLDTINSFMLYGSEYVAPHKAVTALKDMGYDVLAYKLSNPQLEFAFDAAEKCFIIMNGDKVAAGPTDYKMENTQVVFKFTNDYDKDSKFGQYLLDEYVWNDPTKPFEFNASIDVGNNTNIKYMVYTPSATNAGTKKLVRTYCEYLKFSDNVDTIYHMGETNNLEVYGKSETEKCNYMELGKVAYAYVENTDLQIAKINTIDAAEIDILEPSTGVKAVAPCHTEYVGMIIGENQIEGATYTKTAITEVNTPETFWKAIQADAKFIRLTDKITFTDAQTITVKDKSFVLDLAGKKLVDNSTATAGSALIDIQAETADSSLMILDSYRQGEFVLKDHYVHVQGNVNTGGKTASIYLEGANVTYEATQKRNGAIMVGDKTETTDEKQYSRVYMYGGKIEANTESTSHNIEVSGIYALDHAYIQIVYGAIYSSTNCIRSNGIYDGAYIDIVNGTFKTNNDEVGECIYFPRGKLNITGGTFEGHTCLGIKGGNITISGGYFHSTGAKKDINEASETGSGIAGDGSVICVELVSNGAPKSYGTNPSLTVHNATLHSDNSYIMQIFRDKVTSPSTTPVNQYFEVDFFGGVYYYYEDVGSPVYSGIRIGEKEGLTSDNYRIFQNGGSWIKTSEE